MFLRRHGRKLLALTFWVLLLGGYQLYAWRSDLTPVEAVRVLVGFMENGVAGAIVFLAVYTVRPLILFPASVLTVGAGFVFGPILGVVLTVVGSNASATVAYLAGRYFGEGLVRSEGVVRRYTGRLRENSFETVLTMRLVFVPYDLVNYLTGILRIAPLAFTWRRRWGPSPARSPLCFSAPLSRPTSPPGRWRSTPRCWWPRRSSSSSASPPPGTSSGANAGERGYIGGVTE
jgi:uncharacterized membrane protein YdjX (TVP38/TMEM64 family)